MTKLIRKISPHKSIYIKLFLLFLIIGVIPLIVGSFYTYSSSRKALLREAFKEQELEVDSGRRNILILFVRSGINLQINAQNAAFVHYFGEPNERSIYRQEQEKAFRQLISFFPNIIESVGFTDINGNILTIVFEDKSLSLKKGAMNISDRPFFRQIKVLQNGGVYYGPLEFSQASQKWVIPEAILVFNQEGIPSGILFLQIYLESIEQLVKNTAHPEDIVFVVDQKGYLIAHSRKKTGKSIELALNPETPLSYQHALQRILIGEDGSMRVFYDGEPYYITYKNIPSEKNNQNRWSLGVMTPEETIYAAVTIRKYLFFILSASSVLLTIAGILGWRITRPIKEFTTTAIAMSKGDLGSRINLKREDEIGQLADVFNEMAASIQSSHKELTRLSTTDGLTGLYNHRELQRHLEDEIKRARRYGFPLSLVMIDFDYFKKINDTYGHQSGDVIIRAIGTVILREIRGSDFAARYGGEELAIVLPETGSAEAFVFSERVRKIIQQLPITVLSDETVYVTVSIGVASFPEDASNREDLINTADQALYFAKGKGRNKVILYGETIKALIESKPINAETLMAQAEEWIFKDLATSVEAKLPFRRGFFESVTSAALEIARSLKLSDIEIEELRIASMLYEIGALNVPSNILLKEGPLTEEEWAIVKGHPEAGVKLLSKIFKIQNILPVILHHQERYDGTGYPSGLKGEEIPFMARIITVADAYQAMTSVTPYRRKMTEEEAIDVLRRNSGTQFDPAIVETFIKNHKAKKDRPPNSKD